jgi:tetratricopeptide (TPR) repeat protein
MAMVKQSGNRTAWPWGLLLAFAVVATYLPVWHAGFIWDDDGRIWANPCVVGPLGLKEIWTTNAADICPLVATSFWAEHALWGLAPMPYHLVNIALHTACAILLWRVLENLRIPGAWLGAALWAVHPVQVETVAWVTEQKNTQSGFFYLLTIIFFIRYLRASDVTAKWAYGYTLLFAALALASKSSTVVLPLVLGLCAWWIEGRWRWRNVATLAPIAVMAVFPVALTLWTQKLQFQGPESLQFARSFPERLATAGDAVWFYLGKLAWPHPLIFIYPRWQIDAASPISYLPLLALLAALLFFWRKRDTWARPYFFAFAYFIAALLPVLGLVDGFFWRYSLVGDHFQYLASMGPLALAGTGLHRFSHIYLPQLRALRAGLAAALLLLLATVSWQRTAVYQNIDALWSDTLAQNPSCWMAYNNLGLVYYGRGEIDNAMVQYQKALALNARLAEPHNNFGNALVQQHKIGDAISEFETALDIDPYYSRAQNNLGNALLQSGQVEDAIAHYKRALEIDPHYVDAYNNLGNALCQKGAFNDAIASYTEALQIAPDDPRAHDGLGNALNPSGKIDEAIGEYETALRLDPTYVEAHNDLGVTLLQKGQIDEALAQFTAAVQLNPNSADAHYNLGYALLQKGRLDEAIAQYEIVVRLQPGNASARKNLAQAQALRQSATPK